MTEPKKKIQAVIFDYDGTLLDSMPAWHILEKDLAWMSGVTLSLEERQRINSFTLSQLVSYFHNVYGVGRSYEILYEEALNQLLHSYENTVRPRLGAINFVRRLQNDGVMLAVASASPLPLLEAGLKRFDIYNSFNLVISADEEQTSKQDVNFLLSIADRLNVSAFNTWCIDDSVYALKAMSKAGFKTLGIYDSDIAGTWKELKRSAHVVVREYSNINYEAFLGIEHTPQQYGNKPQYVPA